MGFVSFMDKLFGVNRGDSDGYVLVRPSSPAPSVTDYRTRTSPASATPPVSPSFDNSSLSIISQPNILSLSATASDELATMLDSAVDELSGLSVRDDVVMYVKRRKEIVLALHKAVIDNVGRNVQVSRGVTPSSPSSSPAPAAGIPAPRPVARPTKEVRKASSIVIESGRQSDPL